MRDKLAAEVDRKKVDRLVGLMIAPEKEIAKLQAENKRQLQIIGEIAIERDKLQAEVKQLKEREKILNALEAIGVDNWDGYDEAMDLLT